MAARPFTWIDSDDVRGGYVDPVHNLRLFDRGGPDWQVNIVVAPPPDAPDFGYLWENRFYFVAKLTEYGVLDVERFTIGSACLNQHFKRDFPGRAAEFLDSILPLLDPRNGRLLPGNYRNAVFDMPPMLRARLLESGRYSAADERDQAQSGLAP
ncbi:hypothetical protein [Erythrobacter sp. CCH5-A1]|uniref:hypothetical protein n=1 Tax=Erythrobacter sp. CCH5-A1 TaxID=1768792 RepID=UPI0008322EA1|nr:hypothetical protein [Erythrobacter sp. CCH5-A1]